jgi:hypothetical protein
VLQFLIQQAGQDVQQTEAAEEDAEEKHRKLFLLALEDVELIPRADPNTSSQTERYLKAVAMRQMAQTNPSIDMNEVDKRAFQVMGIDDGDALFKPPPPAGAAPPSPEEITAQATATAAQARVTEANTRAAEAASKAQLAGTELQADQTSKLDELAAKERIANLGVARELVVHQNDQVRADQRAQADASERAAERVHKLALATLASRAESRRTASGHRHDAVQRAIDRAHEGVQNNLDRQADSTEGGVAP